MIVSIPILILQHRKQKNTIYYFVCLIGAFLLFNLYLKWQPWNSRLQLPLFILWSALIGLSLSQIRADRIGSLVIMILLLGALPCLLYNQFRPIIGQESIMATSRTELYFKHRPSLAEPYISSAQYLAKSQCSVIGLVLGKDDWEYPFWVLLGEDGRRTVRLEHVKVTNISKVKYNEYPFNAFTPCSIIVVSDNPPNKVRFGDVTYIRKWFSNPVSIFMQ
jgi:hypothetical protein